MSKDLKSNYVTSFGQAIVHSNCAHSLGSKRVKCSFPSCHKPQSHVQTHKHIVIINIYSILMTGKGARPVDLGCDIACS